MRTQGEPPATDAAFSVWSQTDLARLRLTSSVELYAADGTLVSRFALNLPAESAATEQWIESGCDWDRFGEPFAGSEDRVLLHAGRGLCGRTTSQRPWRGPQGAIVVHVMLDYATLPFLASSNLYGDLLQPAGRGPPRRARQQHRVCDVRVGPDAGVPHGGLRVADQQRPAVTIYRAGYKPVWQVVHRGDRAFRVMFLNDRAGIYALGYPVPRFVDHLVALAEIVTMAGVAYVALLLVFGHPGRTRRVPRPDRACACFARSEGASTASCFSPSSRPRSSPCWRWRC